MLKQIVFKMLVIYPRLKIRKKKLQNIFNYFQNRMRIRAIFNFEFRGGRHLGLTTLHGCSRSRPGCLFVYSFDFTTTVRLYLTLLKVIIVLLQEKQTTRPWSTATVERRQSKMAAPAKFKDENGSYSHAILKINKNIFEFFLRIFNLGSIINILKTICFNNRGSL